MFAIPGFSLYSQETTELLASLQATDSGKLISNIALLDAHGDEKESVIEIPKKRHNIIFGLWPWQYQIPGNIKPKGGYRHFWFEPLKEEFYIGESELSISQQSASQGVTIRLIHIKHLKTGFPILTLGTNIPRAEVKTKEIALLYLNRWPYIEGGFQEYLELQKQKPPASQLKTPEFHKPDSSSLLGHMLVTLSFYAQKRFFPPKLAKEDFSRLKQSIYSLPAKIKYHKKAIFGEFLLPPDFEYRDELVFACRRVNESPCLLPQDIRMWLSAT